MALLAGTRLGPYEIGTPLGVGGMGEVYRARDTRLNRTVAIKVLPAEVASDPSFRARFEREAHAVSALDHPHICALYDIGCEHGIDFLVLQYLEGETLASRLAESKQLPLQEALSIGSQVADALDAAHRAGIVHRDLKPANVFLTKSGARLLDFGLAKPAAAAAGFRAGASALATEPAALTSQGTIVGTIQYMSPEQLEGNDADARSDIFALGALLYEMVTGRKAFEGKTPVSVMGAILKDRPPQISAQVMLAPAALDHLIERCLEKNADERWQDARDVVHILDWLRHQPAETGAVAPALARHSRLLLAGLVVSVVALGITGYVAVRQLARPRAAEQESIRFTLVPPRDRQFSGLEVPEISPDGRFVVFATGGGASSRLWLWSAATDTMREIDKTAGALAPFWAPDGRSIGFFADGNLKTADLSTGAIRSVAAVTPATGIAPARAAWGPGHLLLFGAGNEPIQRVDIATGRMTAVTTLDTAAGDTGHGYPSALPDGRFLFAVRSLKPERAGIYLASTDGGRPIQITPGEGSARYVDPGYLFYVRDGALLAQPFDLRRSTLTGVPTVIEPNIVQAVGNRRIARFSVSNNGRLVFRTADRGVHTQLTRFDRTGRELGTLGEPGEYSNADLSPDGRRLAVGIADPRLAARDIWIFDVARGTKARFTFDAADDMNPSWAPDGRRIAFSSSRRGARDIYVKDADGAGGDELVFSSSNDKSVEQWTPDGRGIVYNVDSSGLWLLPFASNTPQKLIDDPPVEVQGRVAPNGRWFAYLSQQSGRAEVYVRSLTGRGVWQVSNGGGNSPQWRADGRALFFRSADRLMVVTIEPRGETIDIGVPHALFQARIAPTLRNAYVAAPDGETFIVSVVSGAEPAPAALQVLLNWPAAFGVAGK